MDQAANIVHVPVALNATLAALLLFLPLLVILRKLRGKTGSRRGSDVPNWSVPSLDAYADGVSFFHLWDPRFKIGTMFCYCFMVVSLKDLVWCTTALLTAIVAVHFCHIPWQRAGKRLLAMSGFLTMFLIVIPFTSPVRSDETLLLFPLLPSFPFHMQGFYLALTIVLKACAVALMMEPMLGTSPLPVTLQGLSRLGLPPMIGQMILLSHRYIFVFLQEITRMYRSMRVRGFTAGSDLATMHTMGNFFGMLFIRSFDRTQQVFEAMLCRGYQGNFPTYATFRATGKDWAKGGLWIIIGILLILFDRLTPLL